MTLSDLIISTGWVGSKINDFLWPVDRSLVWSVPLSALLQPDVLAWHYDSCGSYSVLSGYHVEMESRVLDWCGNRLHFGRCWLASQGVLLVTYAILFPTGAARMI